VIAEASNARRAEEIIRQEKPDVTFLDVQLPDGSGFDVLSRLGGQYEGHTIFVTAHDHHAVRAFDTDAIDYLVKPIEHDRLARALDRVRRAHAFERKPQETADRSRQRLAVSTGDGRLRLIAPDRIDWIEAAGNYIRVHAGPIVEMFRDTLTSVESRLDSRQFIRVHRSSIVNIDRILHLEPNAYGDYVITLEDGTQLPLSRRYRARIGLLVGHL
jgi:two-component system LytT family response regulator